jgi:NADH dehydrogenase (ubiquinone) 1 alpha subcomplex subunit 9
MLRPLGRLGIRVPPQARSASVLSPALTDQKQTDIVLPKDSHRQGVSGVVATVFGASGFLGRYVVNRLGRVGSQCIIPYRGDGLNTRHLKMMGDLGQIVPLPTDLGDKDSVRRAVEKSNVVINLVGQRWDTKNYSLHDGNVKCSYRIAQIAKEQGVERFIQVSTLGADINSESNFLKSKAQGELAVREFYPEATIIRPARIFGDEDTFFNRIANVANRRRMVPLMGDGKQTSQPVYVTDVAAAIMHVVGNVNSVGQTYELGGASVYTQREINQLIIDACYLQSRCSQVQFFGPFAKAFGYMMEFKGRPWINRDMVFELQQNMEVKPSPGAKTFADLEIQPADIQERIARIMVDHCGSRAPARFTDFE